MKNNEWLAVMGGVRFVVRELAKIKTGPTANRHSEWIEKVLALAERAREILDVVKKERG